MIKLVISILFLPAVVSKFYAQNLNSAAQGDYTVNSSKSSLIEIDKKEKLTIYENIRQNVLVKDQTEFHSYIQNQHINTRQAERKTIDFNIVSSFRKNIRFGGFWENYAIINFTPDMSIQPADFISVYANHNYSNYIPITSIKENIKPLVIEGAAILAIDNSVKFLLSSSQIIQSLVSFVAKNIVIGLIRNSLMNEFKPLQFKYYYYAISIRF